MVLVRQEAQELLVSSGLDQSTPEFRKVLQVYDLRGYSLELKRTLDVPDRINCTTYCQPMVLSRDERYVYYAARTTAPECGTGGDAGVCDVHTIWAIGPTAPRQSARPRRCRGLRRASLGPRQAGPASAVAGNTQSRAAGRSSSARGRRLSPDLRPSDPSHV
jgi:hypothetical protein